MACCGSLARRALAQSASPALQPRHYVHLKHNTHCLKEQCPSSCSQTHPRRQPASRPAQVGLPGGHGAQMLFEMRSPCAARGSRPPSPRLCHAGRHRIPPDLPSLSCMYRHGVFKPRCCNAMIRERWNVCVYASHTSEAHTQMAGRSADTVALPGRHCKGWPMLVLLISSRPCTPGSKRATAAASSKALSENLWHGIHHVLRLCLPARACRYPVLSRRRCTTCQD